MNFGDDLIFYNWMPCVADLVLDYPENYYHAFNTIREHDKDNLTLEDIEGMKPNTKIFIKTDFLKDRTFQTQILPKIKTPFILISGVSSYQVGDYQSILDSEYLVKWFCTNPPCYDSKVVGLPIGFEEKNRAGGNQEVLKYFYNTKHKDKLNRVLLPYHTESTNPKRTEYINYLKGLSFVDVQEEKLPFKEYLSLLSRYRFCVCLEGAGNDTHRNYECLLTETIPIMKISTVDMVYHQDDLPCISVADWYNITNQFFSSFSEDEYDFNNVREFMLTKTHAERIMNETV